MKELLLFGFLVSCLCTPLDDYVNAPDPTYSWNLHSSYTGPGFTAYVLNLTSQMWLTKNDSNSAIWKHWLTICIPDNVRKDVDISFIYIEGGDTNDPAPTQLSDMQEIFCSLSQTIVSELTQIPNEPIYFTDDPNHRRTEDAIIAWTWSHFLNNTNEPDWLLRLPMTKAVVKAMDTVQTFVSSLNNDNLPSIEKFVVAGASKRGWTTWTTGIVDQRVIAMIPIVIPILNIVPNLNHHYRAYDGWSFALDDYTSLGITDKLNTPEFALMADIIDPYSYLSRLNMPKYLVCATGDEFFLPDSPLFFYDALPGQNYLRMVPNAEHSLLGHQLDVTYAAASYYHRVISNNPLPQFSWTITKSNGTQGAPATITVVAKDKPTRAVMWAANTLSSTERDFRLITCSDIEHCINPVLWYSTELEASQNENGEYVYYAEQFMPITGWKGFFVELDYQVSDDPFAPEQTFKFSTYVNIIPDIMPFGPCTTCG